MTDTVLIIGGYGVFGGRLAMRLVRETQLDIVVAGRSLAKAENFCAKHGGRATRLDLQSHKLLADIAALKPTIVIDAAGPFQAYKDNPYRVAEAAIACTAHYFDFSDDAMFTVGIAGLEAKAKAAGITVLSGVSSVPAISSVVLDVLTANLSEVHLIETVILPGNDAPRGVSVMQAILAQAGRPLRLWQGARWTHKPGWSDAVRVDLEVAGTAPVSGRRASLIGAPDLLLFPARYGARSVVFRAGLELWVMQRGLGFLAWLVRLRLLRSVAILTPFLKWIADRMQRFGSDRGGMKVRALGLDKDGQAVEQAWVLIAEGGDGPHIPAVPGWIIVHKLLAGGITSGARVCLGAFDMTELMDALMPLKAISGRTKSKVNGLFSEALVEDFSSLPPVLRDLHTVLDQRIWRGEASVTRGKGLFASIAGWIAGFPPAGEAVPVEVEMTRTKFGETWIRQFGKRKFQSSLTRRAEAQAGTLTERFGLLSFEIGLRVTKEKIAYPVNRGRCFGIPLPGFLLPKSETFEFVDARGRACFDVSISLPIAGAVVQYRGWLEPV